MCTSVLNQRDYASVQADLVAVFQAATAIGTVSEQLYLVNANFLAQTCADLKAAALTMYQTTGVLQSAFVNSGHRIDSEMKQINAQGPGWFANPSPAYDEHRARISEMHKRVHDEVVAEPQRLFREADSELELLRARFIERGRLALR